MFEDRAADRPNWQRRSPLGLRYYFDLVCPYSYILGFEVEQVEDDRLAEVDWLPFEFGAASKELSEPRGTFIRDHVYGLATTHEVEIHVPRCQPRSTLTLALHSFVEEEGRGRAYRDTAHRAFFVEGLNLAGEGVLREAAQEVGLNAGEAIMGAWNPERISACEWCAKKPKESWSIAY